MDGPLACPLTLPVERLSSLKIDKSAELFNKAKKLIPGGVDSPVRAFRAVGGQPLFVSRGQASRIWDADGQSYIDYVGSWGPLILGHAHPRLVAAIQTAAERDRKSVV